MQKISFIFTFVLFISISCLWIFSSEEKSKNIFSYAVINSINLQLDSDNLKSIFSKHKSGQGAGTFTLNNGKKEKISIQIGGESTREVFYNTKKLEAVTLHLSYPTGAKGKVASLYGDSSYSREHLAYLVYEDFFELVPENNFVKLSINDGEEKLFLMVENISSDFFKRRKIQSVYQKATSEEVRFFINNKAYDHLLKVYDSKELLKYILYAYLVDDQDGPFAQRGYTENATVVQDKFFHKYLLIPNDLDQTFHCRQTSFHPNIFKLASYIIKYSSTKSELRPIIIRAQRLVLDGDLLENLEQDIYEKLSNCCSEFMKEEYLSGRKDLISKIACQKKRFAEFSNQLLSLYSE